MHPTLTVITGVDAIVYYMGDPDTQLVKIGTTTALKRRMERLRIRHPRMILLATEPGTYPLERRRHHEFRAAREPLPTGETEWFRKTPQIMRHVARTRLDHGIICPGRPLYPSWVAPLRVGG